MSLISVFTDQIRPDRVRRYEELIAELAAEARKVGLAIALFIAMEVKLVIDILRSISA